MAMAKEFAFGWLLGNGELQLGREFRGGIKRSTLRCSSLLFGQEGVSSGCLARPKYNIGVLSKSGQTK